jgi:CRISPR-associated exonuclease Cas4
MFSAQIQTGALYYGQPRRRTETFFSDELRRTTESLARRMHELHGSGKTPLAVYEPKCNNCSLIARCLPRFLAKGPSVARYLARARAVGEE